MISEALGSHFSYAFSDVIDTRVMPGEDCNIGGKSLIFTSQNGAEAFLKRKIPPQSNPVYCVGNKAKQALENAGWHVQYTASSAQNLADYFEEISVRGAFLHFTGNLSLNILKDFFADKEIPYQKIEVYRTGLLFPKIHGNYDAAVFFSPSGVRSFAKFNPFAAKNFAIGATTAGEIKKFTDQPVVFSAENTTEDLLNLISKNL